MRKYKGLHSALRALRLHHLCQLVSQQFTLQIISANLWSLAVLHFPPLFGSDSQGVTSVSTRNISNTNNVSIFDILTVKSFITNIQFCQKNVAS